jgi:hypothetical protein
MRVRFITCAIGGLFASVVFGQTQGQTGAGQSVSQVFHFTYMQGAVSIQQLTNAIRTVAEITQSTLSFDAKTLTVGGTPTQVAMAAWIFNALDQPAPASPATQEFRPAGSVDDVVRLLYLTHPQTTQSFQDIVNSVRVIPDMSKVFPYSAQNVVVMRGTDSQAAMTEWLFRQLDVAAGVQPAQGATARQYVPAGVTNDEVQVLYLTHPWNPQSMQQIVNTLRVIPQLTRVFPCNASGAVSVRGPTATVALAAWLFGQLDQTPPAASPSPREFRMPGGADDVTQVYYLTPATTPEAFKNIVTTVRTTTNLPVFPDDIWHAVTLRGTAAQIASADLLIRQMN